MGAETIRDALALVDLESTVAELHEQMHLAQSRSKEDLKASEDNPRLYGIGHSP